MYDFWNFYFMILDVHFANSYTDREPPRQNYFQVKWPAKIPAASPIDCMPNTENFIQIICIGAYKT